MVFQTNDGDKQTLPTTVNNKTPNFLLFSYFRNSQISLFVAVDPDLHVYNNKSLCSRLWVVFGYRIPKNIQRLKSIVLNFSYINKRIFPPKIKKFADPFLSSNSPINPKQKTLKICVTFPFFRMSKILP
jgi:hypothetical protein